MWTESVTPIILIVATSQLLMKFLYRFRPDMSPSNQGRRLHERNFEIAFVL